MCKSPFVYRVLLCLLFQLYFSNDQAQVAYDSSSPIRHPNAIDDIQTSSQIEKLLKKTERYYADFHVTDLSTSSDKCKRLSDSVHAVPYFKADFDHNGYTDLIVIGYWGRDPFVLCMLDSGKENPTVIRLTQGHFNECSFPVLTSAGTSPAVDYYYFRQPDGLHITDSSGVIEHKKLLFMYGGFVEYNPTPVDYKIEKIEYESTMCYGRCPAFKMTIDSNRDAIYEPIQFNIQKPGKYRGQIDKEAYGAIENLLNYTNFAMLNDSYRVGWTDDQTSILKITYDNGKVKTIQDYGLIATFGLSQVYKLLLNLRGSQSWK